jgi:hypothetical protein
MLVGKELGARRRAIAFLVLVLEGELQGALQVLAGMFAQ